jgi:hypothetical protein
MKTFSELLLKYPVRNPLWDVSPEILKGVVHFTTERSDFKRGQPFLDPWNRSFTKPEKLFYDSGGDITHAEYITSVEGHPIVCREYND